MKCFFDLNMFSSFDQIFLDVAQLLIYFLTTKHKSVFALLAFAFYSARLAAYLVVADASDIYILTGHFILIF